MGIYTHYEIFWKKKSDSYLTHSDFRFADAIADTGHTIYHRLLIPKETLEAVSALPYALSSLPNFSTEYDIGVSTYYDNGSGQIFRVNNAAIANGSTCTTSVPVLIHGGWKDIFAVGPKTSGLNGATIAEIIDPTTKNVYEGSGSTAGIIRFQWGDFGIAGGALNFSDFASGGTISYKVYTSTTSSTGPWTLAKTVAPILATTSYEVIFGSITSGNMTALAGLAPGTTYWFKVAGNFNGTDLSFSGTNLPIETVRITLPPNNMSLMHRWIANQEICSLLQKATYPNDNYRCDYNGLASTNNYYDMGQDLLVDRFELGCNFSQTACSGGACIGGNAPSFSNTAQNAIYYSRNNSVCYIQTANPGNSWVPIYSLSGASLAILANSISTNTAYMAPLAFIDQDVHSWNLCQGRSVTVITSGTSSSIATRLLRHKEFIAGAAWRASNWEAPAAGPSLIYGSGVTIDVMENGTTANNYCNSNFKGGNLGVYNSSDDNYPGASTNIRAQRTGSNGTNSTKDCQSRYGMQDMVGNVWEWNSDQIQCSAASCTSNIIPTIDIPNANILKNGDGNFIDFATPGTAASVGNTTLMNTFNYFSIPLGLPLNCTGGACVTATDDNTLISGKTTAGGGLATHNGFPLNGDAFWIILGVVPRGAITGGAWSYASQSGRFTLALSVAPSDANYHIGARCAVPLP
jgi:hypothetical protein